MNLSPNFTLAELTASEIAMRRGIDNTAPPEVVENLTKLASLLELVREILGNPIHINNGYRCPELNAIVGGAPTSAHLDGRAADFVCPGFGSPHDVAKVIAESGLQFDQLIYEGNWVHIAIRDTQRQQVLTARFDDGKVTYTQGIA